MGNWVKLSKYVSEGVTSPVWVNLDNITNITIAGTLSKLIYMTFDQNAPSVEGSVSVTETPEEILNKDRI